MKTSTTTGLLLSSIIALLLIGLAVYAFLGDRENSQEDMAEETGQEDDAAVNEDDDFSNRVTVQESFNIRFAGLADDVEELKADVDLRIEDMTADTRLAWQTSIAAMELRILSLEERFQAWKLTEAKPVWVEVQTELTASLKALEDAYLEAQADFIAGS